MQGRKAWGIRVGIVAAAIVVVMVMINRYFISIEMELKKEIQETLHDAAEQTCTVLEREINSEQELLSSLAEELQSYSLKEHGKILELLKPFADVYHLKRMGVIEPDGTAYTTDGYVKNLSFRDFFRDAMEGKRVVTDMIMDSIGEEEPINVFSVPIYGEGQDVRGVLFATYRTRMFRELMNVESFGGLGYSYVVKKDGTVIVDSKQAAIYGTDNMFDEILSYDGSNRDRVSEMKRYVQNDQSGGGSYLYEGERYYYCIPLYVTAVEEGREKAAEWYMFTIVPAQVLDSRLSPIMRNINRLMILMAAVLGAAVILYLYSYHARKKELMRLAYMDPLTQGDNYVSFAEKLKRRRPISGYLISMDIGEFKIINNTCGVDKGDQVLQSVWEILKNRLEENELAAHINADRFVLYLGEQDRAVLTQRLRLWDQEITGLSARLNIPRVVPYFGVYEIRGLETVEKIYSHANQAKHLVKGRRDRCFGFYEEVDYRQILRNKELEDSFDDALKNRRFEVWYQPKYGAKDGEIVGSEALVRWRREDGSMISPGNFIPLFEKNGMISALDEYMFDAVCRQQKKWEEQGKRILPVSVNISRASLYYANIADKYKAIRKSYGLDPQYVQIEITESATIDNSDIKKLIDQFHEADFKLLLDDFGNGYSSLASLNTMHFDTLKLDKSLIDYIGNVSGEKLLYHTIKLAKSLGLKITAEGVEEEHQVRFLRKLECNDIQGYYFSKPLPAEEYQTLIS